MRKKCIWNWNCARKKQNIDENGESGTMIIYSIIICDG